MEHPNNRHKIKIANSLCEKNLFVPTLNHNKFVLRRKNMNNEGAINRLVGENRSIFSFPLLNNQELETFLNHVDNQELFQQNPELREVNRFITDGARFDLSIDSIILRPEYLRMKQFAEQFILKSNLKYPKTYVEFVIIFIHRLGEAVSDSTRFDGLQLFVDFFGRISGEIDRIYQPQGRLNRLINNFNEERRLNMEERRLNMEERRLNARERQQNAQFRTLVMSYIITNSIDKVQQGNARRLIEKQHYGGEVPIEFPLHLTNFQFPGKGLFQNHAHRTYQEIERLPNPVVREILQFYGVEELVEYPRSASKRLDFLFKNILFPNGRVSIKEMIEYLQNNSPPVHVLDPEDA